MAVMASIGEDLKLSFWDTENNNLLVSKHLEATPTAI
jgi:hypothetical protein